VTTVYFWLPDVGHAAGGVRAVYRLVDACNASGIDAAVMHQRRGFRARWFENATRVVGAVDTPVRGDDILVVSELDAPRLLDLAPGVTKVVLNQHQYWTFVGGPVDYKNPDVASVIAVSEDGIRYLTYAFPGLVPMRLRYAVDTRLFQPGLGERERKLVYLATKGALGRNQVMAMLENRGVLVGWTIQALAGLTQEKLASVLGGSAILASFSESEGFQMLLTEAMASGCAVVGYPAGGGGEYLTESRSWPVKEGDVVAFAARIEELMTAWDSDRASVQAKTDRGREHVARQYTLSNEAADIISALAPALARARGLSSDGSHDVADPRGLKTEAARRLRSAAKALIRG
jgi:glycosyltransferase involved in cell wall biosynthesis